MEEEQERSGGHIRTIATAAERKQYEEAEEDAVAPECGAAKKCFFCGDKTHIRRDCAKYKTERLLRVERVIASRQQRQATLYSPAGRPTAVVNNSKDGIFRVSAGCTIFMASPYKQLEAEEEKTITITLRCEGVQSDFPLTACQCLEHRLKKGPAGAIFVVGKTYGAVNYETKDGHMVAVVTVSELPIPLTFPTPACCIDPTPGNRNTAEYSMWVLTVSERRAGEDDRQLTRTPVKVLRRARMMNSPPTKMQLINKLHPTFRGSKTDSSPRARLRRILLQETGRCADVLPLGLLALKVSEARTLAEYKWTGRRQPRVLEAGSEKVL
jgi:hypothetical protein